MLEHAPRSPIGGGRLSQTSFEAVLALVLGSLWFCGNNLNLIRAQLQAPEGTQALWAAREIDVAQHLTWTNAMVHALVIPNFHMPAVTEAGLFCGLTWLMGQITRLGVEAAVVYACAKVVVSIVGVYCVLVCLRIFVSQSQYLTVGLLMVAAVSVQAPLRVGMALSGRTDPVLFSHVDGFFVPGPLTNAVGTVSVFASLALCARYVLTGRRRYLFAVAAVAAVSGWFHPFEVFTIMAATALTLLVTRWPSWHSALRDSLIVCIPGILSVVPYIYFSLTVPWVRHITELNSEPQADFVRVLARLGPPVALALGNLVAGPRLRGATDVVLQCWFVAVLLVIHVPKLPFPMHAADGLTLITALLAARQLSEATYLTVLLRRYRVIALVCSVAILVPALFAHAGIRYLSFREALKLDSPLGLSAVAPQAEVDLIGWFRGHGSVSDVVITHDPVTSWMIATAPVHSVASHWLFSGTYDAQSKLRDALYSGAWSDEEARQFFSRYGINYVVVPNDSPLRSLMTGYQEVAAFPPWTLYHIPENRIVETLPDVSWTP